MAPAGSGTPGGRATQFEPLSGLDGAFLALETGTNHLYVAGVFVLDPPGVPGSDDDRYAAIRAVIERRLSLVPRLGQRAVRVPLGLQRPVWVDDPDLDLDAHVHRMRVAAPGGRRELDDAVGEIMSRALPLTRPLWEMVVVEGLAEGRTAVVARLHHAILDGVSGARAMAAFLDLTPPPAPDASLEGDGHGAATGGTVGEAEHVDGVPETIPSAVSMLGYAARELGHQPAVVLEALRRSAAAMVDVAARNRRLAAEGASPPPALFRAHRTSLNGTVSGERSYASIAVPLDDLRLVRRALGDSSPPEPVAPAAGPDGRAPSVGVTINDVVLCAVGGAVSRLLDARGGAPAAPLVALVPVSVRGHAAVPADEEVPDVGNYVSGMLVSLAATVADPVARLHAVARATRIAKEQEELAGGDLLEGVTRAIPPLVLSAVMRGASLVRLFERAPPFNLVVSTVVVPDVSLWWASHPVGAVFPVGPISDGVGLNVTSMTYRGTVHFGLLGCSKLAPDLDELAVLLDDALAELVAAALDARPVRP